MEDDIIYASAWVAGVTLTILSCGVILRLQASRSLFELVREAQFTPLPLQHAPKTPSALYGACCCGGVLQRIKTTTRDLRAPSAVQIHVKWNDRKISAFVRAIISRGYHTRRQWQRQRQRGFESFACLAGWEALSACAAVSARLCVNF